MRRFPLVIISVLLLLPACQASKSVIPPKTVEIEGMRNSAVTGDVMIGGQPTVEALKELSNQGYKSIVTVRSPDEIDWDEEAEAEALGMSFHRIEMSNPIDAISDDQVEAFAAIMAEQDGPMVLHCGSGNRVAALWASWLIDHKNVEPSEAIRLATGAGMRDNMKALVEKRVLKSASR